MKKKKRRKWVRYEREHSMSLWQGDWKKLEDRWIIAFMDDASRFITCYGVFDSATTENTIKVFRKGFAEYDIPDEILTDHGTQFVAAKNREKAKHRFKEFLAENGNKTHSCESKPSSNEWKDREILWPYGAENPSF